MSRLIAISVVTLFLSGCAVAPKADINLTNWRDIKVGSAPLRVELALTIEQQTRGLSGRDSLAPGTGMLFKFAKADKYTFWMKDMKFALDFIWVSNDKVAQLNNDIPPPTNESPYPVIIKTLEPIDAVIEVPAGWVKGNSVKVGDNVVGDY
ncbi:MAG: DUF192 domain-containing protein [Patescibacteria group bacterium]